MLRRYSDQGFSSKLYRMLFNARFNDAYSNIIENRQAVMNLLIAAARMGLPVMELPDKTWQELNAEVLIDECMRTLRRSTVMVNHSEISVPDYLKLQIDFCGIRPKTRRLKFQWASVYVQLDTDALYEYVHTTLSASTRVDISRIFNRRIQDKRYVFATHTKCSIPESPDAYQQMNDETFALMFDWLMHFAVDRWIVSTSRYQDFTSYSNDCPKSRRSKGASLKPWLVDLPFEDSDEFERFNALASETIREITKRHLPVLYRAGRSLGPGTLLTHDIPAEQVTKLMKLLEEHDEVQGPRQPEPLPESMGCDDGA